MFSELEALNESVEGFMAWRRKNEETESAYPNLSNASLVGRDLREADFGYANLTGARIFLLPTWRGVSFGNANLSSANLQSARFDDTDLSRADLQGADCREAVFFHADLQYARLVDVDLDGAQLAHCGVYGISVWNVSLQDTSQSMLYLAPWDEPMVDATDSTVPNVAFAHEDAWRESLAVDDLEVAQFLYVILRNERIRNVIQTLTTKLVLILGNFSAERKSVLDALRSTLRDLGYLSVIFDFEGPSSRTLTQTVSTLAHLARFVIADITDARSIPQELQAIVPSMPSVPIQPILLAGQKPYGMFGDFSAYSSVLPLAVYKDKADAVLVLQQRIIQAVEIRLAEIQRQRTGGSSKLNSSIDSAESGTGAPAQT